MDCYQDTKELSCARVAREICVFCIACRLSCVVGGHSDQTHCARARLVLLLQLLQQRLASALTNPLHRLPQPLALQLKEENGRCTVKPRAAVVHGGPLIERVEQLAEVTLTSLLT